MRKELSPKAKKWLKNRKKWELKMRLVRALDRELAPKRAAMDEARKVIGLN
jgi:hypothetical protein